MNASAKLGAYGLVLAAVVGGGAALGSVMGPIDVGADEVHGGQHAVGTSSLPIEADIAGLSIAEDGYRLVPEDRLADAGTFAFAIVDADGETLRDFQEVHERELHLIVVSRNLHHFAHVHPTRDAHGRWSVELPALPAGAYRGFADFQPTGGRPLTLGVDLVVPGSITEPAPLLERRSTTVDEFEVTLEGSVHPGRASEVTVTVRRSDEVVTTDPYLGAAGHLVALRDGDLAYLHVHPLDDIPAGPLRFAVEAPSPGTYALFFDFSVDGQLHTARFIVAVDGTAPASAAPASTPTTSPPSSTPTTSPPAGHGADHDH